MNRRLIGVATWLIASAIALLVLCLLSARFQRSINSGDGSIREEITCGPFVVWRRITDSTFSKELLTLGVGAARTNTWYLDSSRAFYSGGPRINTLYDGLYSELQDVAETWDVMNVPIAERRMQARQVLSLLAEGKRFRIRCLDDGSVLITPRWEN